MEIRPVVELMTPLEVDLVKQVLQDRRIPCKVEMNMSRMMGVYLGEGTMEFAGFARIWTDDAHAQEILDMVAEVREASFVDDPEEFLPKGRMWRIKKS